MKKYKRLVCSLISLMLLFAMTFNVFAEIATVSSVSVKETANNNGKISNSTEVLNIEDRFRTEISMLNYLTVITQEIKENKNRLLLDSTYNTLYDGMHLDAVDKKTQTYIKNLANTVFELTMLETKRNRIEYLYEQKRAGAIMSAIPNPIGLLSAVQSGNMYSLVTSGAYMIIDSVAGYNSAIQSADAEYLKSGWEIDDKELADINTLNGNLWDYKNDMRRDNKIPSDLILNEDKIKEFVKWKHYDNVDSKISFFESNIEAYKGYPTLWLVLAQCYYEKAGSSVDENGRGVSKEYLIKCIDAVKQYELNSARIFIKDSQLAKIVPLVIASAEMTQSDSEYISIAKHYLGVLEKNMKNSDWDLQYFATQTYIDIYRRTKNDEFLYKAFNKAKNNVINLVLEQRNMNNEYKADYVEQKPKSGATEAEKKEIKEFNKKRKEEREYELPPILEPLRLNLDLLLKLAEVIDINDIEKQTIDNILHTNGEELFLFYPLDEQYWYKLPEKFQNKNYADDIKTKSTDKLEIPINYIGEFSDIKATYENNDNKKTYEKYSYKVDRKKGIVTITFKDGEKKVDFKVNKDTKLHVEFYPLGENNSKIYSADFINNGGMKVFNLKQIGIFSEFERSQQN